MNKKVLAIVLAIVVIGAGLFMFLGSDDDDEPNDAVNTGQVNQAENENTQPDGEDADSEASDEADARVAYTDNGFEPNELAVTVGQTVIFVNNSSRSMWVASDDHPTHTDDPDFDDGQGVGPGEAFAYTFDEVGEWGYHNHLNDSDEGTITVTAN